jgi:hypothetical protein
MTCISAFIFVFIPRVFLFIGEASVEVVRPRPECKIVNVNPVAGPVDDYFVDCRLSQPGTYESSKPNLDGRNPTEVTLSQHETQIAAPWIKQNTDSIRSLGNDCASYICSWRVAQS